ncbi:MAG: mucoidy inhibitor MuiA family protein [Prevotellaceae bacterium]|jgi:hypothetical protein|nr:mucoidy inhibitor MuiA family protein [Prevotellaceae bacterium]
MKHPRKLLSVCLLCCVAAPLSAQLKVSTQAEKVTLFIDGAQVTRTKQVDIPAGVSTLVFTGLSPYLDDKSMQVTAKGRLTVTAVNRQFNFTDSLAVSQKQQSLQAELKSIEKQQQEQHAAIALLNAERDMVKNNSTLNGKDATPSPAVIREVNQYYADRLKALSTRELTLKAQLDELDRKHDRLNDELKQLTDKREKPMSEVVVGITAPAAGKATFTLSYYVKNAGWFPSYDIRSTGLDNPVSIVYKANLFQNTREQWQDVALSLSSSNPSVGNVAPQLKTYWLDYGLAAPHYKAQLIGNTISGVITDGTREPIIGASISVPGTTVGAISDLEGRYSLTVPDDATDIRYAYIGFKTQTKPIVSNVMNVVMEEDVQALEEVVVVGYGTEKKKGLQPKIRGFSGRVAGVSISTKNDVVFEEEIPAEPLDVEQTQTQTGYEYDIKLPYTISSENKPVVAEIGHYDVAAAYIYQSTPKLDKDAFLTAQLTGWEQLNLLDGEANIYFEDTFIGKSVFNVHTQSDTLSLSLGRDRRISVQRVKEKAYTSRQFIGNNQTQTLAWKITVRNTRQEPVTLTLYDQLPVSRNNSITVTPEELGGGTLNEDNGTVTWLLTLQPGEQRDLSLRYRVKYPKGRSLVIE